MLLCSNALFVVPPNGFPVLDFGSQLKTGRDSDCIRPPQSLTTGFMAAKRLRQWRPDLADELYRTWVELEQRGLKKTPEYRNVMLRADRQAWWLAGLTRLSSPDSCGVLFLFKGNRVQRRAEPPQQAA